MPLVMELKWVRLDLVSSWPLDITISMCVPYYNGRGLPLASYSFTEFLIIRCRRELCSVQLKKFHCFVASMRFDKIKYGISAHWSSCHHIFITFNRFMNSSPSNMFTAFFTSVWMSNAFVICLSICDTLASNRSGRTPKHWRLHLERRCLLAHCSKVEQTKIFWRAILSQLSALKYTKMLAIWNGNDDKCVCRSEKHLVSADVFGVFSHIVIP